MSKIHMASIDAIRPSTYNPREADAQRLDMVELSLRKLGWLLPIYATPDGEIISGHQRHLVAKRMGMTSVPVETVEQMDLQTRKSCNVVFNRATNDLGKTDTSQRITQKLNSTDITALAAGIVDKSLDYMPCLQTKTVAINDLIQANSGRWGDYARNLAGSLYRRGIIMPVVVGPDLQVVNGIGRVQYLAERKHTTIEIVELSEAEAKLAGPLLNWLSMDFDIQKRYADFLRHNSFRRARRQRFYLGGGFLFVVAPNVRGYCFDILNPEHRKTWLQEHGTSILDFGAGHLTETDLLRQAGISCTPFEPYRLRPGTGMDVDKAESVQMTKAFLNEVASGKRWSSIFISSVLNSVPFLQDRRHIVTLLSALADRGTRVYAYAQDRTAADWKAVGDGAEFLNLNTRKSLQFELDYEDGILIGDLSDAPKVQKFHHKAEFKALFEERFRAVTVGRYMQNVTAVCAAPKAVDPVNLAAAIEFEFDLPYPDGSRMGLVTEAKQAFAKRLGLRVEQLEGQSCQTLTPA